MDWTTRVFSDPQEPTWCQAFTSTTETEANDVAAAHRKYGARVEVVRDDEVKMSEKTTCQREGCGASFAQKPTGRRALYCEAHRGHGSAKPKPAKAAVPRPKVPARVGRLPESPYEAVLADLVAKRDQLNIAIEALEALV